MDQAAEMKSHMLMMGPLFLIIATACSIPSNTPTANPDLPSTPTQSAALTPSAVPSPTRATVGMRAKDQPVNCRFGPGIVYDVIGGLRANQPTLAEGRNFDGTWLYIHDPGNPGGFCWVIASAVEVAGHADMLTEVNAPVATVTRLEVHVDPQRITVPCEAFPQLIHFTAEITANGPVMVSWHWEIIPGEITPEQILIFEQAGARTVERTHIVTGPNDYRVRLYVFDPAEKIGQADFFATCTP